MKNFTTLLFLFASLVSYAQTNEQEPNNSFGTANYISKDIGTTGNISSVSDYDFFVAYQPVDGSIKIYVKGTNTGAASSYCYLTLYAGNKSIINQRYLAGKASVVPGATVYDTITLYGHGVDSLFFKFQSNGTFSYDFNYEFNETKNNDVEPNGSFALAVPIKQNETKFGHIGYVLNGIVDNYDYYRTKTPDDGTLKIYVSATNSGASSSYCYFYLYAGNKTLIDQRYISGTANVVSGATIYDTITLQGRAVDSVFFRFQSNGTFSYDFKYKIEDISINDIEPNNTLQTSIKTDFKQINSGHLMYNANGTNDYTDYYVIPASASGDLKIIAELTIIGKSASWVFLNIYNKSNTMLLQQYIKRTMALPAGELIRDTIVLKCAVLDTFYLKWTAGGVTNYKFSLEIADHQPHASMTHERLGNAVGFRPQLANADKFMWDFGDGTSSAQKYPMKTYKPGYYTAQLIATNSQCHLNDTAKTVFEIKGVEYFTPDSSGVGGDAIVKIFGGGLDTNTKIRLKMGAIELTPIHLEIFKNNVQLNAIFDFHLAEEGTYDVSIEIKGQSPVVYPGGFKLTAFRYPYTWSEIVSPTRMRTNLNTNMKLVVGNKGNVMASGALVCVIWPKSVDLTFDTKWFKPPASGNYTITAADTTFNFKWEDIQPFYSDTFNSVIAIDTFDLKPYDGFMELIIIPKIGAGSTVEIPLIAKTTSTGTKDLITYTYKPNLFGSGVTSWLDWLPNVAVEVLDLTDKAVSAVPAANASPLKWVVKGIKGTTTHLGNLGQVMGGTYNYLNGTTNSIYESLEPAKFNPSVDAGNVQFATAVFDVAAETVLKKGFEASSKRVAWNNLLVRDRNLSASSIEFLAPRMKNMEQVRDFFKTTQTIYKNYKDFNTVTSKVERLAELVKTDPQLKPLYNFLVQNVDKEMTIRDLKFTKIAAVTSFDPNEIIGPVGQSANQYVLKQERQQFTITFENKDVALAAAQIVTVYDTLDATKFDLNTFEFTDFTIANKTYTVPKGRQEFVLQDSLSPVMKVRINGSLEKSTGIVSWQFTAIDPATGDIPVFEGFLPPNKKMPEGEGSVSFTILPKQSLADGAVIRNRASIIFDQNEPILTNTWQNIVDALPPVSAVTATRVEGSPEIHLTFTGSDASSGIANYDIYIQEEGGEWQAFGNAYGDTETILADSSKRYSFYVLANDQVGNTESKTPGAETTVGMKESVKGKGQLSLWPTPAADAVFIGGLKQTSTFIISDLSGKKIMSGIVSETNNSIEINKLAVGMYILRIYSNGSFESLKLLKNKGR
jgi:hypothetical protein